MHDGGEEEEEKGEEVDEVRAPDEAVRTPAATTTTKRKLSTTSGTATPVANVPNQEQAHKRGRKPGAAKKPLPRGWTEAESISLLQVSTPVLSK